MVNKINRYFCSYCGIGINILVVSYHFGTNEIHSIRMQVLDSHLNENEIIVGKTIELAT
jgi:hypothetical protein